MKSRFVRLTTRRYRRKGAAYIRRHTALCSYCKARVKLMDLHFRKYHPKKLEEFAQMLGKGQMGVINGMRVVRTFVERVSELDI